MSLKEAVGRFVNNGDAVFLGGFVAFDPVAASHEIIRQRKRELTISKAAGLTLVDQLIGAGCVTRLISTWVWNEIPRAANCFRRAIVDNYPNPVEMEEYSLLALTLGYFAGAMDLPFAASKTLLGSDMARYSTFLGKNKAQTIKSPFNGEEVMCIPPVKHDVGIVQVQRADDEGNAQAWGPWGPTFYGVNSCSRVIVCAEEVVDREVIRRDPNRTMVLGFKVCAVVEEPWGSHPEYVPGCYDRDWEFLPYYYEATRTTEGFENYLKEWVFEVKDRQEYVKKLGEERLNRLKVAESQSFPANYGSCDPKYRRLDSGESC